MTLRIAQPAALPRSPVSPQPLPLLLSAVALGLILAPLAALAAHRRRSGRDISAAIRTRLAVPVLAEIPRSRKLNSTSVVALLRDGDRHLVEAFQKLRTGLAISELLDTTSAVVITSVRRKAGRSTVAAGLSWAMAERFETCLIDADLRRPSAHAQFDEPFGPGLANSVQLDVRDLLRSTSVPNLALLPAGESDRHPADIALTVLRRVLEDLAPRFTSVVVDAPPLGMAETPLIVATTRWAVLVVDGPTERFDDVEAAVHELRGAGATFIGVVVNRARVRRSRHALASYTSRPGTGPTARPNPGAFATPTPPAQHPDGPVAALDGDQAGQPTLLR